MEQPSGLSQLIEFPCDYQFKAFGLNDEKGSFFEAVRAAVASVHSVPLDAMKGRPSAQGTYLCVTVLVRLHNADQLKAIYAALRQVEGLKYLL
jgi:hypothetical protein